MTPIFCQLLHWQKEYELYRLESSQENRPYIK